MDQCRSGLSHRSQALVPVPTKRFGVIHNNPSVPGRGCVELGEVWGDLPFFVPEIVRGAKSFTAFPFVRSRRALPQSSAVLHRLLVVGGKVVGNFSQYCPEVVQHCVRASKNW